MSSHQMYHYMEMYHHIRWMIITPLVVSKFDYVQPIISSFVSGGSIFIIITLYNMFLSPYHLMRNLKSLQSMFFQRLSMLDADVDDAIVMVTVGIKKKEWVFHLRSSIF